MHGLQHQPGLGHQVDGVAAGEPAQVGTVEDAVVLPRPAPAHAELPERVPVAHVGQRGHGAAARRQRAGRAAQHGERLAQVLEHVGGNQAVKPGLTPLWLVEGFGRERLEVGLDHLVEALAGPGRVGGSTSTPTTAQPCRAFKAAPSAPDAPPRSSTRRASRGTSA
jgi:hypothetical protein